MGKVPRDIVLLDVPGLQFLIEPLIYINEPKP